MHRGTTTIAGQIAALIRRMDGVALCDDCITDRLDLSVRSQANVVTRSISGTDGFERLKSPCGLCGSTKTVIRHKG